MRRLAGQHGFTLVELLMASTVTVLVAGSAFLVFQSVAAAQQRIDRQMALQADARAAIDAISLALRNAWRPADPNQTQRNYSLLEGIDDWAGDLPNDRVRLFSVSGRVIRPGFPESDVRDVEFSLAAPDPSLGAPPALMRRTDPTLNPPPDRGGVLERVAENVIGLDVTYHDGLGWRNDWPASSRGWPQAVRLVIVVASADPQRPATWSVTRLINFVGHAVGAEPQEQESEAPPQQ